MHCHWSWTVYSIEPNYSLVTTHEEADALVAQQPAETSPCCFCFVMSSCCKILFAMSPFVFAGWF